MNRTMPFPLIQPVALLLALLTMLMPIIPAQAQNAFGGGEPNITAAFELESEAPKPGETVTLALTMSPAPTWHGYWANPGDAGIPATLKWTLPEGVGIGELSYPVPDTLVIGGIMNFIYEEDYALLMPLTLDASIAPGTELPVSVKAEWLACTDEICVPEEDELSFTVIAGDGTVSDDARARFDGWRARLPAPLGNEASYAVSGETIRISIPFPATSEIEEPYFFPLTDGVVDYSAPQTVLRQGDNLVIETGARSIGGVPLQGVLRIGAHQGLSLTARDIGADGFAGLGDGAVAMDGAGSGSALADAGMATFLLAFGGAIIGGLLLNIFPCVFPILSLKAISLAKAGGAESHARRDALAYTAGIVLFCLALGGAMLALRAFGAEIGWGFQLQDPRIIFVLLILFTAIAFNLAGLFELGTVAVGDGLASQSGARGAFWTGALAALVATPCSAPFMATAMGAAIVLPPLAGMLIFVGLGLGLALPFLILGFAPPLRKMMPRPGPWMDTFRRIMSVPMFISVLALAWLLGQQTGNEGLMIGLSGAMIFALFLWWVGRRQQRGAERSWLPAAPALAAAVAALLVLPVAAGGSAGVSAETAGETLASEAFSETRLASLRAEGRPVFAYFTADWCITCKANEAAAVQRQATADAFAGADVAVLKGDWTRRDAEITRYLEEHGRSGVPLYVYYAPGGEAKILPQVLTVDTLTSLVS
ncbi:MAG: protein-disulfide reductase DsbD domain-containing protein [Pseudomonadota bacterium]